VRIPVWPWRRVVQLGVVLSLFAVPVLARYTNYLSARQLDKVIERWDGTVPGEALRATDAAIRWGIPDGEGGVPTRRPRKAILDRAQGFQGSPWSARLFGVSFTDLLAGAESALASRDLPWILLVGIWIPLLLTLLLGRVFCGWLCPMGLFSDLAIKLRSLLRYLEVPLPSVRFWPGNKYVLLGVGLLAALVLGVPVLHAIYPPAIFGREAHGLVTAQFDRAESGLLTFAWVGLTGGSMFLLLVLVMEVAFAPGFWCRSLCPGGAVYALLSKARLLRVRRDAATCEPCGDCNRVCPMALRPMVDATGIECDACGLCLDVCPSRSLGFHLALTDAPLSGPTGPASGGGAAGRGEAGLGGHDGGDTGRDGGSHDGGTRDGDSNGGRRTRRGALVGLLVMALASPAAAHHIMGIPHYAYDESYPQAPVLKLAEQIGPWEVQLTGYPGKPEPGERSQVNVYLADSETRELYRAPLRLRVHRQALLGPSRLVYGPEETEPSENLYKFYPTYPEEGNYEVTLEIPHEGIVSTVRFPMVVGDPGSPWATVGGYLGGFAFLLVVIRAIRIKRARRLEPAT